MMPDTELENENKNENIVGNAPLYWTWGFGLFIVVLDGVPVFETADFEELCETFLEEQRKLGLRNEPQEETASIQAQKEQKIEVEEQKETKRMNGTRQEHLAWCKHQAIEYVNAGDNANAISSMLSGMGKHPETKDHPALQMMVMLMFARHLKTEKEVREFILGFN